MTTFVGTQDNFNDALKEILELEYDAIEAYKAAISRLKDQDCIQSLGGFLEDHNHHRDFLISALKKSDCKDIPTGTDLKSILTKGKVVLSGLLGDKSILEAMKTNEDDTNKAYERLNDHKNIPTDLKSELSKFLSDERRHRSWIEDKIKKL